MRWFVRDPLWLLVVALLVTKSYQFSEVSSTQFGSFDFLELESTAYQIEIATTPVSELHLQENSAPKEDEVVRMPVISKHGQLYSCSLPPPMSEAQKEEEEEAPTENTLPNITSLLESLKQQGCILRTVGWWTYEYCHNTFVRQYHMEAGKIVGETKYLGFYDRETVWNQEYVNRVKGLLDSFKGNMVQSQTQAFHAIHFVNGTECDITGQPRSARVEMFCSVEGISKIVEVKEHTTCNYTITVHTPLLCQHPMLTPLASSTPKHTLSCFPVVSQLDYEDFLLKQELIRQQKEKLKILEEDASDSVQEKKDSLLSSNHLLLRRLVMSSITQLAEIAYDTGNLELGEDDERELNEIDEEDEEFSGSYLNKDPGSGSRSTLKRGGGLVVEEGHQSSKERVKESEVDEEDRDGQDKVSDKMKKMAKNVKSTGRDSALESLLSNLAVTAQYIESFNDDDDNNGDSSNNENSDREKSREPKPGSRERSLPGDPNDDDHSSVKGPAPPLMANKKARITEKSNGDEEEGGVAGRRIGREIMAASKLEREEEDEGEEDELDSEMMRDVEQQLQDILAKQFDTNDVKVKIITLPEDQAQQMEDEKERDEIAREERADRKSSREDHLSNAMSLILDSLLNGEEDQPESEDRQRQTQLAASYDHVWGREQKKRQIQKDT